MCRIDAFTLLPAALELATAIILLAGTTFAVTQRTRQGRRSPRRSHPVGIGERG